ncbi:hypothetical protein S1361_31625 [Streptomyces cyanogenus]|uniref:Uncharacterized protein n=1 Tax=Streptomyces cyanogenus TaxID=80860 RepID=A0ABX7U1T2_STRCY|nr:hypothetical protein S1361_31625 [Streptomyces cyanogenus]
MHARLHWPDLPSTGRPAVRSGATWSRVPTNSPAVVNPVSDAIAVGAGTTRT